MTKYTATIEYSFYLGGCHDSSERSYTAFHTQWKHFTYAALVHPFPGDDGKTFGRTSWAGSTVELVLVCQINLLQHRQHSIKNFLAHEQSCPVT